MKIYTKRGDRGMTDLFGGDRVAKDHLRVAAYGDVDELNACVGVAAAASSHDDVRDLSRRIQNALFDPVNGEFIIQASDGLWQAPADLSIAFEEIDVSNLLNEDLERSRNTLIGVALGVMLICFVQIDEAHWIGEVFCLIFLVKLLFLLLNLDLLCLTQIYEA